MDAGEKELIAVWDAILRLHKVRQLPNLRAMKMWEVQLPHGWAMAVNGQGKRASTTLLEGLQIPPYEFAAIKDGLPWVIAHPLHGTVVGPNLDALREFTKALAEAAA